MDRLILGYATAFVTVEIQLAHLMKNAAAMRALVANVARLLSERRESYVVNALKSS